MRATAALRAFSVVALLLAASGQSSVDADGVEMDASAYPVGACGAVGF